MDYLPPPPDMNQVTSQYVNSASSGKNKNVAYQARVKAITDSGKSIGIKSGINYRLYQFNQTIEKHERDLDLIYNFGKLMINGRIIPPVITEVRDVYSQDDDTSLKISGISYKIESQARISSVPPNWRSYLSFGQGETDFTAEASRLSLKGDESAIYERAIKTGFQDGINQANKMIEYGFDKLNRDYTGMIRFNVLVFEGRVSMPILADANIPITQTGDSLTLDEKLLRITVLPTFNSNLNSWKAWITPSTLYKSQDTSIKIYKSNGKKGKK